MPEKTCENCGHLKFDVGGITTEECEMIRNKYTTWPDKGEACSDWKPKENRQIKKKDAVRQDTLPDEGEESQTASSDSPVIPSASRCSVPKAETAGQKPNEVSEGMPMQTQHPSNTSSLRHSSAEEQKGDWLDRLTESWSKSLRNCGLERRVLDAFVSDVRKGHEAELNEEVIRYCCLCKEKMCNEALKSELEAARKSDSSAKNALYIEKLEKELEVVNARKELASAKKENEGFVNMVKSYQNKIDELEKENEGLHRFIQVDSNSAVLVNTEVECEKSRQQGRKEAIEELEVWHRGECVRSGIRKMPDFPCSICGKLKQMKEAK